MLNRLKYIAYISKDWLRRLYIYPQNKIMPGHHFDYDTYWKEKRGDKYIGRLGVWQKKRAELAVQLIKQHNGRSINDIGSGSGEVLNFINEKIGLDKAICYDSSKYALNVAEDYGLKAKFFDINKDGEFGNIEEADYTIMFEILEHIPGPEALLKEVYSKSNKGVLFTFPNTGFFIHRFRLFFFGKFPLQWQKHPAEHIRFWTKKDLIWWLRALDYENFKIHYYVGIPFLKTIWPNMFCAGFFIELNK